MADQPRRRRMSRDVTLVLLSSLPGLAGCGSREDGADEMVEVGEVWEDPAPDGPGHLIGGPFVVWWQAAHPPTLVRQMVPRSAAGGTSPYRSYPRGRSGFLSSPAGSSRPGGSPGVTRGGFGSAGHAAAGG